MARRGVEIKIEIESRLHCIDIYDDDRTTKEEGRVCAHILT